MGLAGDGHVHSEWSWDVGLGDPHADAAGLMDSMCRRAVQIGLPALAFTEHLDVTGWPIEPEDLPDRLRPLISKNGVLTPPLLDAEVSSLNCAYSPGSSTGSRTSTRPAHARSSIWMHWIA